MTNSLNNEIATRAKLGGHNLFKVAAETLTIQGVTFTRNSDGSFTVNGTASGNIYYNLTLSKFLKFEDLDYVLTGCPSGGSEDSYSLFIHSNEADSSQWQYAIDYGNGISFLADSSREYLAFMYVKDGYTISNKTFYPMIRLATDESADYEPYSMTNQQITKEIGDLPSITYGTITAESGFTLGSDNFFYINEALKIGLIHANVTVPSGITGGWTTVATINKTAYNSSLLAITVGTSPIVRDALVSGSNISIFLDSSDAGKTFRLGSIFVFLP